MRIISRVVPGVSRLAGLQVELSRKARQRLKWFGIQPPSEDDFAEAKRQGV